MATFLERATTIIEALADANVARPKVVDTMEEFLNKVDDGASAETLAEEFVGVMSRILDRAVVGNAEGRARAAAMVLVREAGEQARGKIPDLPDKARGRQ